MGMREDVSKKGYISTFSKALSPLQNTRIPTNVIQKYVQVREWQVHLQQISDFLSHQLTSTLKDEETYLRQCWQKCTQQKIVLPTHNIIHIDLPDGKVQKIHTCTPFLGATVPADDTTNLSDGKVQTTQINPSVGATVPVNAA